MTLQDIKNALSRITAINVMQFEDLVNWYSQQTNQNIPFYEVEDFYFTGLENIDFLTSDYLVKKGYKNIYHFTSVKNDN